MNLHHPSMNFVGFLLCISITIAAITTTVDAIAPSLGPYKPEDNYLINCGSSGATSLPDGRTFTSDADSTELVDSKEGLKVSIPSADVPLPIYLTAQVFRTNTVFNFKLKENGWHWVRLHFFPITDPQFDLTTSVFDVQTDQVTLLHSFSMHKSNKTMWTMKEYLLNVTTEQLSITFNPRPSSTAFINAIEVVSAPAALLSDKGISLDSQSEFTGLSNQAYQIVHRVNVGGPILTPQNDTLGRNWETDEKYVKDKRMAKAVTSPGSIKYPQDGLMSDLIAPSWVYSSAVELADAPSSDRRRSLALGD